MADRNQQPGSGGDTAWFLAIGGIVILIIIGALIYSHHREPFNRFFLMLIKVETAPLAWVPGLGAHDIFQKASTLDPAALSGDDILDGLASGGRWLAIFFTLVVGPMVAYILMQADYRLKFNRMLNYTDMLLLSMERHPCIAPALRRNLWNEPYDVGPWAVAKTPVRFVADNKLLLDRDGTPVPFDWLINAEGTPNLHSPLLRRATPGVRTHADDIHPAEGYSIDRESARAIFATQVGDRFGGIGSLPVYQQALAAALFTFGASQRERAEAFLDQMSRSFREPVPARGETPAQPMRLNVSGYQQLLKEYSKTEAVERALKNHSAFTSVWFMALLTYAREKGVLPTAEFLWLRPTNRTLWYTLNQVGGRTCWVEGAGPWAHFAAEEVLGECLYTPEVETSCDALLAKMENDGWLPLGTPTGNGAGNSALSRVRVGL